MGMTDQIRLTRLRGQVQSQRRALGERSLRVFARIYFGHFMRKPDGKLHAELYPKLQQVPQRPGSRIAIAAPRGSAKSTLVSLIFVLWGICHRKYRYTVLISDTADKASDFLGHIKDELRDNERIREDFPELAEPSTDGTRARRWSGTEIITRTGVKVTALGYGQNIRGKRHREERPDLIILDDVESGDNTATPEARAKLADWFGKSILKAGTPQTSVLVVGTIQHYDSLLARLTHAAKSPLWDGRIYRSILSPSLHPDLWEQWAKILHGYEGGSEVGPNAARSFFEAHRAAMLEGTDVLWQELEDYYTLMLMRETEGPASFDSEKQNEPVNPQDCFFLEEDFRFWDDRWDSEGALLASLQGKHEFVGACDPSLGKQGKNADDSAIITLLRDTQSGTLYVVDADLARRKPDRIIDDILAYQRIRKYHRFGFETNQFQSFLAEELKRRSNQANLYLSVQDIQHSSDKVGRIQSLQPLIRSGALQFSRRHTRLLEQLRFFPKAAHDDGPDALEMAVETARERFVPITKENFFMVKLRSADWPF